MSSGGEWVKKFEEEICKYTQSKFAIAVTNGTVGLRLALHCIGVKPGDEVIVPPLTFVATANSISHLGAYPHFVDIEKNKLSLSPLELNKRLEKVAFKKGKEVFNIRTGRDICDFASAFIWYTCRYFWNKKNRRILGASYSRRCS